MEVMVMSDEEDHPNCKQAVVQVVLGRPALLARWQNALQSSTSVYMPIEKETIEESMLHGQPRREGQIKV